MKIGKRCQVLCVLRLGGLTNIIHSENSQARFYGNRKLSSYHILKPWNPSHPSQESFRIFGDGKPSPMVSPAVIPSVHFWCAFFYYVPFSMAPICVSSLASKKVRFFVGLFYAKCHPVSIHISTGWLRIISTYKLADTVIDTSFSVIVFLFSRYFTVLHRFTSA